MNHRTLLVSLTYGLLAVMTSVQARAGVRITMVDNGCAFHAAEGYPVLNYEYTATPLADFSAASANVLVVNAYGTAATSTSPNVSGCYLETNFQMDDAADLQTGNMMQAGTPLTPAQVTQIITQWVKTHPGHLPVGCTGCGLPHTQPAIASGTRDIAVSGGVDLSADAPAYESMLYSSLNAPLAIPFVVNDIGTNGTFSVYGPSGVLWSQPLAQFIPGILYFAMIAPQTNDPDTQQLLTLWLHGTADGSVSDVYIPDSAQFIPTATLTASTANATVGHGVSLTWSAQNADSCVASGGAAGDGWSASGVASSGNLSVTETAPGPQTYTLSCAGGEESAQAQVTVTFSAPIGPSMCDVSGPAGTPDGEVSMYDIAVLSKMLNQKIVPSGPAPANADPLGVGAVTAQNLRKCTLMCSKANCAN